MNPLNEDHLADMIRMSNLRQILNFSILMIWCRPSMWDFLP